MKRLQEEKRAVSRTAPRDVRRRQLILAAMDSISKRGFSDTTLKHVTQKAKLSHGVVNYHFESKEALYDATIGYLAEEHYEIWTKYLSEAPAHPADQLAALIAADFDKKVCTAKKLAVWFAFWGQAKYRPNYLKIHNKYDDERDAVFKGLCSQLISEGEYGNLKAERVTRSLVAMIDGYWLDLMLYPAEDKRLESKQECLQALALFFPKHFDFENHSSSSDCATHD